MPSKPKAIQENCSCPHGDDYAERIKHTDEHPSVAASNSKLLHRVKGTVPTSSLLLKPLRALVMGSALLRVKVHSSMLSEPMSFEEG